MMSRLWNFFNSPELVWRIQSALGVERVDKDDDKKFRIRNKFFYYLFIVSTELGDELFYGIFIPVFFFNIDSFIGRRFVLHWFINMYVGGALKQFFKEKRPESPAIPLQTKWSNEYSLPSTHAMGSFPIAACILYFALDRYDVNLSIGIFGVLLWVSIISMSRVYLGMHSVLDLLLGIFVSFILLVIFLPITNEIETILHTSLMSPFLTLAVPTFLIFCFPTTADKTPTKGDTCTIAGVFSGIELGTWFSYQVGLMTQTDKLSYPLALDLSDAYSVTVRTIIGLSIAGITEFIAKKISLSLLCWLLNENCTTFKESHTSAPTRKTNFIDLSSKFLTYCLLGFNVVVVAPIIFKYLNFQRESFFSEL